MSERHPTQCLLDKGKPVVRRGRKAMGLNRSEGGTDKAARLPKGWTGPVSTSGTQATQVAWVFLCADLNPLPDSTGRSAAAAGRGFSGQIGTEAAAAYSGATRWPP